MLVTHFTKFPLGSELILTPLRRLQQLFFVDCARSQRGFSPLNLFRGFFLPAGKLPSMKLSFPDFEDFSTRRPPSPYIRVEMNFCRYGFDPILGIDLPNLPHILIKQF